MYLSSGSAGTAPRAQPRSGRRSCLEIAIAPAAVRIARQWTAEQFSAIDPPLSADCVDTAVLLVSELVTNAIGAVRLAAAASTVPPVLPTLPVPGLPVLRLGELSLGLRAPGSQAPGSQAPGSGPPLSLPGGPSPSGPARVWMVLTRLDEGVRIEVHDSSCAPLPPATGFDDEDAEGGRGLTVVAGLAASWGWQPDAFGKVVWCEGAP